MSFIGELELWVIILWVVCSWCECFAPFLAGETINGDCFLFRCTIGGIMFGRLLLMRACHDSCCAKSGVANRLLVRGWIGGWICIGVVICISGSVSANISHGSVGVGVDGFG